MKKLLAILLALLMMSVCAFAEEAPAEPAAEDEEVEGTPAVIDETLNDDTDTGSGIYMTSLADDQGNDQYEVYMDVLPDGAEMTFNDEMGEDGVWHIHMDGVADIEVYISKCGMENAAGISLADVTGDHLEELKAVATIDYDDPEVEILTTPSGNQYMHIYEKDESLRSVCTIFTLYKGAIIELVQYNEDFTPLTETDHEVMEEVLHGIEIYEA